MMTRINFNGKIIPSDKFQLGINNRAFKYGDSLFETIRVFDGTIPFIGFHFNRLIGGLSILGYNIPKKFNCNFIIQEINKLTKGKGNHRIRLMVFREDGGLYSPTNNNLNFIIERNGLKKNKFSFPKKGLSIGLLKDKLLISNKTSHLKTGNSLPYIYAALEKQKKNWDDCLIKNNKGKIVEAISSNIFIIKNNKLLTPPITSGCISGITRKLIIENIKNIQIEEKEFTHKFIKKSDGILLSNSIQGIKWVRNFEDIEFQYPVLGKKITQELNKLLG